LRYPQAAAILAEVGKRIYSGTATSYDLYYQYCMEELCHTLEQPQADIRQLLGQPYAPCYAAVLRRNLIGLSPWRLR